MAENSAQFWSCWMKKNNGYILNFVHGNSGSYTYTKEIIDGNSIVQLGSEEEEALNKAIHGEQV